MKKGSKAGGKIGKKKTQKGLWTNMDEDELAKKNGSSIRCLKLAQKAVYVLVLFILTLILLVQIWECFVQYVNEPTYVETKVTPQHKALFPAMTICPQNNGYNEDSIKKHGIPSKKHYNDGRKDRVLAWTSNDTSVDPQTLFRDVTYNLTGLVQKIYVRFIQADKNGKMNTYLDLENATESFTEQRHRSFGRCYTFHPKKEILDLGVYYSKIWFKIDVKLYFHGPDQFLDLSGRMGYKLYNGEIMQSQITVTDITILERDVKEDKNDPNFRKGQKTCSNELYDDCIYNMLARTMREDTEDNCTVPYIRDDSKICTNPQDANTSFWIAWNRVTNQRKDCNIPCHSATVSLGAKNYQNKTGEQDYGLLYLYYAPRVTQSIEHLLYTILNLFAEIGGYVGLILGYSLFHVAALISGAIETKVKKMEEENKIRIKTYHEKEDGRQSSWSGETPKT